MELEKIEVQNLPELKGWKEKMELVVKENPFIEIVDNQTFIEAKKNRTALVSARTDVQKQDAIIAKKLKDIRSQASKIASELISITEPHELKQQDEVKKYESIKEQERIEKERFENERISKIKTSLNDFDARLLSILKEMTFQSLDKSQKEFEEVKNETKYNFDFEEFTSIFEDLVVKFNSLFTERIGELKKNEKLIIENEQLRQQAIENERKANEERKKLEEENKRLEEERQKERIEQAKKDLIEKKKQQELQEKLDALEEEKRLAKAKEEKEIADKKQKENEAKILAEDKARQKRLANDKKKAKLYIQSWSNEVDCKMENNEVSMIIDSYNKTLFELNNRYLEYIDKL